MYDFMQVYSPTCFCFYGLWFSQIYAWIFSSTDLRFINSSLNTLYSFIIFFFLFIFKRLGCWKMIGKYLIQDAYNTR